MNEEKSLIDYCHVDKNDDGDRFVGLKSIDDNGHQVVMVYFPCGYNLPSDEVGIRNDIINLFRILADFSKGEDILLKVKSNVANVSVNFPISAVRLFRPGLLPRTGHRPVHLHSVPYRRHAKDVSAYA